MTAQVNEEAVPAFFIGFGAHRDAATGTSLARKTGKFTGVIRDGCMFSREYSAINYSTDNPSLREYAVQL
jgi:hypothetical protein